MTSAGMLPPAEKIADGEPIRLEKVRLEALKELAGLKDRVEEDVMQFSHESFSGKETFKTKSTVGIMLNSTTIDEMVIGGPAYSSQKLDKGDTILKIDNVTVTRDNISALLVGNDIPGSEVTLSVKKGFSNTIDVTLTRMATVVIADRRRLFEYFTSMKDEANGLNSPNLTSNIDKVISLWTKMTISESEQQRKVKERVHCMQGDCSKMIDAIAKTLSEMELRFQPTPSKGPGRLVGVGLILEQVKNKDCTTTYTVGQCVMGSPAQRCGVIFAGDVLKSVGGNTDVSSLTQEEMASLITGPEGSTVALSFQKNTLSCTQGKLLAVELTRNAPLAEHADELSSIVVRMQEEARMLRDDLTELHNETVRVDASRSHYKEKCTEALEGKGKVERDLLFAKQCVERCYMNSLGRAHEKNIPANVVDMTITALAHEITTRTIDLHAQALAATERIRAAERELENRQQRLETLTRARDQAFEQLRSSETACDKLRRDMLEQARIAQVSLEQRVHQAETAAQDRVRKAEIDFSEVAKKAIAEARAEADAVKSAGEVAKKEAEVRNIASMEAVEAADVAKREAVESVARSEKLAAIASSGNIELRKQLCATLEALALAHVSLCKPRGSPLGGLGIKLVEMPLREGLRVDQLVQGGVAFESGKMAPGDVLVGIDRQPVKGMPIDKVRSMILGPACTKIELTFTKDNSDEEICLELTRSGGDDAKEGDVAKYADMLSKETCAEAAAQVALGNRLAKELEEARKRAAEDAEKAKARLTELQEEALKAKEETQKAIAEHAPCEGAMKEAQGKLQAEEGRNQTLREELARQVSACKALEEKIATTEKLLKGKISDLVQAEKEVIGHVARNDALVIQADRLERDVVRLKQELEDALRQLEMLSRQLGGGNKEVDRLNGEIGRLRREIANHPKELADASSAEQQAVAKAERAASVLASSEVSLQKLKKALGESQTSVAVHKAELDKEKILVKQADARSAALEGEVKAAQEETGAFKNRLEACLKELERMTGNNLAMARRLEEARLEVDAAHLATEEESKEVRSLKAELVKSEAQTKAVKGNLASVEVLLEGAREEEAKLKAEVAALNKHLALLAKVDEANKALSEAAEQNKKKQQTLEAELSEAIAREDESKKHASRLAKELDTAHASHHELALNYAGALEHGRSLISVIFGPDACESNGTIGVSLGGKEPGTIKSVERSGPVDARLYVGDVITAVNGMEVGNLADDFISKTLLSGSNGTPVTVVAKEKDTGLSKIMTAVRVVPGAKKSVKELAHHAVVKAGELQASLSGASAQLEALKILTHEKEEQIKALDGQKRGMEEHHKTLQEKLTELLESNARLKDTCRDMAAANEKRENELLSEIRFTKMDLEMNAKTKLDELLAQIQAKEESARRLQVQIAEKDKTAEQAKQVAKNLGAEVDRRVTSEEKLHLDKANLTTELEAQRLVAKTSEKDAKDLREVCQSLRTEMESLRQSCTALQAQYTSTREELGSSLGRNKTLEEALADKHAISRERETLLVKLEEATWKSKGLDVELTEEREGGGRQREAIANLQKELDTAKGLLATMTETSTQRVHSLEKTLHEAQVDVKTFKEQNKELKEDLAATKKELAETSKHAAAKSQQCSSAEATLESRTKEVERLLESEKGLKIDVSTIQTQNDDLKVQVDGLKARALDLATKLESASGEVKKLTADLKAEGSQCSKFREVCNRQMNDLETSKAHNLHLDKSLAVALKDLETSKAHNLHLDKSLAVAVKEIEMTRSEVARLEVEAEGLVKSLKESQYNYTSEKEANQQLTDEARNLTSQMVTLGQELEGEREEAKKHKRAADAATKEATRIAGDTTRMKKELHQHPIEIAAMKAAVEEAGSKADKAQRECDRFITLLSSARKETETERAAKERAEEVIAALRLQLKAKDDIERQLFLTEADLESERDTTRRMSEEMGTLREIREMLPKMESDRSEAAQLAETMMAKLKSVEDASKAEYARYEAILSELRGTSEAQRFSIKRLSSALEGTQRDLNSEQGKLASSLRREEETSIVLNETQDQLERTRIVLQEERKRYDELAMLSEGFQRTAVSERNGHLELAAKLVAACMGAKKLRDAVCDVEGMEGDQGGVGVQIAESESGSIVVNQLLPGGAAAQTGRIKVEDTVLSVNGKSTEKMSVEEVRAEIVGCVASPVTFELERGAMKIRTMATCIRGLSGGRDDVLQAQSDEGVRAARALLTQNKDITAELAQILPRTKQQVDDMRKILDDFKEQAETEKQATRAEITGTLTRNAELERLLAESQREKDEKAVRIVDLEWETARFKQELNATAEQIKDLGAERDDLKGEVKRIEALLATQAKIASQLKEDQTRRQKENEEAFTRNSKLSKELEATKKELQAASGEVVDLKAQLADTKRKLTDTLAKVAELHCSTAQLNAEVERLKKLVQEVTKMYEEEHVDRLGQLEQLNAALADSLRLSGDLEGLTKELASEKRLLREGLEREQKLREEQERLKVLEVQVKELPELREKNKKVTEESAALARARDMACAERDVAIAEYKEIKAAYAKTLADVQRLIDCVKPLEQNIAGGLGMKLQRIEDAFAPGQGPVVVKRLLDGGVAQKSGQIDEGDVIVSVDGQTIHGMPMEAVMNLILGKPGSKVSLKGERGNDGRRYAVELVRSGAAGGAQGGVEEAVVICRTVDGVIRALKEEISWLKDSESALQLQLAAEASRGREVAPLASNGPSGAIDNGNHTANGHALGLSGQA